MCIMIVTQAPLLSLLLLRVLSSRLFRPSMFVNWILVLLLKLLLMPRCRFQFCPCRFPLLVLSLLSIGFLLLYVYQLFMIMLYEPLLMQTRRPRFRRSRLPPTQNRRPRLRRSRTRAKGGRACAWAACPMRNAVPAARRTSTRSGKAGGDARRQRGPPMG